jgi:carbonic anhydrase/acetyltransferase-like protein (isoleucine patch superfamily)
VENAVIIPFEGKTPSLANDVFVADTATVLGDVRLGEQASVWHGCVLRGDVGAIEVGARTNIQDLTVIHVTGGKFDTTVGADVTVGHRCMLHGCAIGDLVLVGMGAILLDGSVIERECLIGAGALVTPGMRIAEGSLAIGSPARVMRQLTDEEREHLRSSAAAYVELAARHRTL